MIKKIKKRIKIIVVLIIVVSGYCSKISAKLRLGIDIPLSRTNFKEDFGGNILPNKWAAGLNVFTNYMFNRYIGGELGVEMYKKMKHIEPYIPANTVVAGVRIPNYTGYSESYKTTIRQEHFYMGLVSKYEITQNICCNLLLGASLAHIKAKKIIFEINHVRYGSLKMNNIRTFSKTIIIPIIKLSIENKFNNNFGVRFFFGWKQTSLFKIKSLENPNSPTCIKAKDALSFGVGAIYYI